MTETLTTEQVEELLALAAKVVGASDAVSHRTFRWVVHDGHVVSSLATELLALRKRVEWQDISTAPKDGTRFLAGRFSDPNDGYMVVDRWSSRALGDAWDGLGKFNKDAPATHWQPLPDRPLPLPLPLPLPTSEPTS